MSLDRGEDRASLARKYRHLAEAATDPLFLVDADDYFEIVNGEFLDLVGYAREEIVGMAATEILHEEDVGEWEQRVRLLRADAATESETWSARIVTKNGTEAPVDFELSAFRVDSETDASIVGTACDARERRRREQRLNILNRALRHNIRNRMNLVLGHAETLQEVDDEGYRTTAEQIERIGEEVINISDKARRAHKHLDIPSDEDCRTDLVEVARQVVTKFDITYPKATVEMDLPDSARARAPPAVEIALTELLENAAVHHPSGNGPAVVEIEADEERVALRVKDECEPVPQAVIDTLEEGEESRLHHNEGIGLWLVQWVVETVGGELSFGRREDGTGNAVTLTFDTLEDP
jgi:PAS domain S-box-containing protein